MPGEPITFFGDAMAAVVHGLRSAQTHVDSPPVVVGGLAVLSRLSNPYRATVDLDLVDRALGETPQLDLLRAAPGARHEDPAAVLLPTPYGSVRIDVLEVRQIEIDQPSEDAGDRLHASAHAWASDTATELSISVQSSNGDHLEVETLVAEPGPLVAMKLQAVMDRPTEKRGTDLLDIVRLTFDDMTGAAVLRQLRDLESTTARDVGAAC